MNSITVTDPDRPGAIAPRVVLEREAAADDSDTATAQTVRRMCQYIRESAGDPMIQRAAAYAHQRFGAGANSPEAKAWGAFWWTKHCIKFRLDEATMFRIGERDQQDLLISPAVLVRMKSPAEDCDGFTMMEAALLTSLGVPVVVATVAVDPRDPSRWSHVFPCALLPGGKVQPLDASHGIAPGWMVPPRQISRWQAWDLDGNQVDVKPMQHQGLHGYMQAGRGMGETCLDSATDEASALLCGAMVQAPATSSGWDSVLQGLAVRGVNILGSVFTPPSYQQTTTGPGGSSTTTIRNTSTGPTAFSAVAPGSTNTLLLVGGGLVLVLVVMSMAKKD